MIGLPVGLALCAALFHAAWNVHIKSAEDPLRFAASAVAVGTLLATPLVAALWLAGGRPALPPAGWGLAVLSGGVELAYFHALADGYRRGDVSSVYPIARGTAPVLAALVGVGVLGEHLQPLQAAGVAVVVGGIWLSRPPARSRQALVPAVLTGVLIAAYQAVDAVGVGLGPWWLYAWAVFACRSVWLLPWARLRGLPQALAGGALTTCSYGMVLAALSVAPLALVAPLREAGVVIVGLWGVYRMGERDSAVWKLVGATAVLAGIGLLAVA
jgi:drug/metabolite transporter (DMT)-like permease